MKEKKKIKPITKEDWEKSLDWLKEAKLEREKITKENFKRIKADKIKRI